MGLCPAWEAEVRLTPANQAITVHRTSEGNKCPGTGKKPSKITARPGGPADGVCSVCRRTWVVSGGVLVPHWSNGQCPGGGTKPAVGLAPVATHYVPGLNGVGFVEVSGARSTGWAFPHKGVRSAELSAESRELMAEMPQFITAI